MNISEPTGGTTDIFLFAHQDDEFAAFELLSQTRAAGRTAICIYLTSGDYGGQPIAPRNAESRAVLVNFGVRPERIYFLGEQAGIGDGTLHLHAARACDRLVALLKTQEVITQVFLPAWEGGHQDHDAAHIVGIVAAQRLGLLNRTFQFPLYNGYALPGMLFRVMTPLAANGMPKPMAISWPNRLRYVRHCLAYPTQWKTWLGLFPFVFAHYIIKGVQVVQSVSLQRVRGRPHAGPLLYERRNVLRFEDFTAAVSALVDRSADISRQDNPMHCTRT